MTNNGVLTEVDEEPAEAFALVLRHRHDTRHVILLLAVLLLGEVAHQVAAHVVVDGEHVEEEGLYVVVERLVVEEQLGEEAQVLAVDLIDVSIHLKYREFAVAVDLVGGRVVQTALFLQHKNIPALKFSAKDYRDLGEI